MMNLQQLNTFCSVIKEGSMTAAAQKLFLTQPAISQQIRQLEEDIGVELLVRGSRKTKPTAQGALLFDYANKIIALAKNAELAIQSMGDQVAGPLRVGTLNSLGLHLISPVFSIFLKNNKKVNLNLMYGSGNDMLSALDNGEIEMAILPNAESEYSSQDISDKESMLIGRDEMWLVCSAKEDSFPQRIFLKEYASQPLVHFNKEYPGFEKSIEKEMKKHGITLRPIFESSNVGSLKRIIESGLGWGFLPAHSIRKQVSTGRMRRVIVEDFMYSVDLICYYSSHNINSKTTEVFLNIIKQQHGLII